jgi:hypothetical protein
VAPSENVKLVERLVEAGIEDAPEEMLKLIHPDVEWIPLRAGTEGVYRGHAGIERFIDDTRGSFESFEPRWELKELPDGRVLAWGAIHVRGRGSGVELDVPTGGIFDFRDGLISRWQDFGSREKALEATTA